MRDKQKIKPPISHEKIFKMMFWVTFVVAGIFLLKNVISKNMQGTITVGASLGVFGVILLIMHLKKLKTERKEFVVSMGLLFLVFIISLNSGESYSDDFPMFLAVIGMTGLYLEPKFTRAQIFIASILLVLMYVIHPEKAGELSQYILCLVIFILAASLFYQTIKRGRAFLRVSEERAKEAENLLASMKNMGEELEKDFAKSSASIENNTRELQQGSVSMVQGANDMTESCDEVLDRIYVSEESILELNDEVGKFEQALKENRTNVEMLSRELSLVGDTIYKANEVFGAMEKKMSEVASIAEQLNTISFNTSILSLNASIEAARAGEAGAGFDVVATEMRELSNNSNLFSEQVSDVVKEILSQVEATSERFVGSTEALKQSEMSMAELKESFERLNQRFDVLYGNIEKQNGNVNPVNAIFADLRKRVLEMKTYSADNQGAVESIVEAMELYKVNINQVIENTKKTKA